MNYKELAPYVTNDWYMNGGLINDVYQDLFDDIVEGMEEFGESDKKVFLQYFPKGTFFEDALKVIKFLVAEKNTGIPYFDLLAKIPATLTQ